MNWDWAFHLLSSQVAISNGSTPGVGTTTGVVPALQSTLSGTIPVLFPTMIAVAVLFGGYRILKALYHSRF